MFSFGRKPRFYTKTKSLTKLIKTRIDAIKKKRSAVERYLKNDVADLLRNGFDSTAYGRAEGLLIEQNMTCCYDLLDQFCECIKSHISEMQKQRDCPSECREAVPTLMYAAARFSDLPELRDLRTLFHEKYGSTLEPFVSKEFVERLRSTPTKEMKLQVMQEIAKQFSIVWDSKALEQKLFQPPPPVKDYSIPRNQSQGNQKQPVELRGHNMQKRNDNVGKKYNIPPSSSDDEGISNTVRDSTSRDSQQTSSSSIENALVSEDEVESKKPFYYRLIPPPYLKSNAAAATTMKENVEDHTMEDKNERQDNHAAADEKPKPKSVRRRRVKSTIGSDGKSREEETKTKEDSRDQREEEEEMLDRLLMKYSKKKSVNEVAKGKVKRNPVGKSEELHIPPTRASSVPTEETSSEAARKHARTLSVQPDIKFEQHVHPKMPDYDEVAARIEALRLLK